MRVLFVHNAVSVRLILLSVACVTYLQVSLRIFSYLVRLETVGRRAGAGRSANERVTLIMDGESSYV